jgi:flagellar protein FlbT
LALKVELKPGEKIILGEAVVTNGDTRTKLLIDGDVPILREKDILTAKTADSPAKRIYLVVQYMYLCNDISKHEPTYFTLAKEFLEAAPSALSRIEEINNQILTGNLYKALKRAKALMAYEKELMGYATGSTDLRSSSPQDASAT